MIAGKTFNQWCQSHPLFVPIAATAPVCWTNTKLQDAKFALNALTITPSQLSDAAARLERFGGYLAQQFPQLPSNGLIESPLVCGAPLLQQLNKDPNQVAIKNLWLKCDHQLPISGSIKARGGFHEILKHAEQLAIAHNLISVTDDYRQLTTKPCLDLFAQHSIVVGSTGNLGLAIGIISAKLGFNVTVHMSDDAKQWKKDKLRQHGVTVIEHQGDYGVAVEAGRAISENDPNSHFVDDENSVDLFMGYAVAALRLEQQLKDQGIVVDQDHPLFVYLPCGVGGAPGGITWGLKTIFNNNVHCFFAEPTHSPAMLLGLYTELHQDISVNDLAIDNKTQADGLAVGRPSGFVGKALQHLINGCYTLEDDRLFELLALTYQTMGLTIEPSAAASIAGPATIMSDPHYLKQQGLLNKVDNINHIAWTTGGDMVPWQQMSQFIAKGQRLLTQ
ncbi:MAG: D-serine ammonia-lyase [Gammaproteobacteria bacterium]|nr:D-serine ammonia-lyase [Gammaproteobacteria bacterium]